MSRSKTNVSHKNHVREAATSEQQRPQIAVPHETICEIAYYKWQAAGCPCGDGVDFWLEAEAELSTNARQHEKLGLT